MAPVVVFQAIRPSAKLWARPPETAYSVLRGSPSREVSAPTRSYAAWIGPCVSQARVWADQ